MKLSIITLALAERRSLREKLEVEIQQQIEKYGHGEVEHLVFEDHGGTAYGLKMSRAFQRAQGDYICVVDDDDWISPHYVPEICAALRGRPDVVTFCAFRKDTQELWSFHSGAEDGSESPDSKIMTANHLCVWRRELAQSSVWLPLRYAPDVFWYRLLNAARPVAGYGETHIPEVLYYYRYDAAQTRCQRPPDCSSTVERCSGGIFGWRIAQTGLLALSAYGVFLQPEDREVVLNARGKLFTIPRTELEPLCYVDLQ